MTPRMTGKTDKRITSGRNAKKEEWNGVLYDIL